MIAVFNILFVRVLSAQINGFACHNQAGIAHAEFGDGITLLAAFLQRSFEFQRGVAERFSRAAVPFAFVHGRNPVGRGR
mgnify:CR=1 FL=1